MQVRKFLPLALFFSSSFLLSQTEPGFGTSVPGAAATAAHRSEVLLAGRVRMQDGAPPPQAATIQCSCGGAQRNIGYTDSSGDFTVQVADGSQTNTPDITNPSVDGEPMFTASNMKNCDVSAVLPGFTSSHLNLSSVGMGVGVVNAGTLILTPATAAKGFTVSAADYAAPDKAKK